MLAFILAACTRSVEGKPDRVPIVPGSCTSTVVVALDVSLSMQAKDVVPTRWEATRQALREFAQTLDPGANLGLVSFAGTAIVQVSPTTNRVGFAAALDGLQLAERTATGDGIFAALRSIEVLRGASGPDANRPDRIVLISDGKQTVPSGLDEPRGAYTAAREAARRNVQISTVSVGTATGTVEVPDTSGNAKVEVPAEPQLMRDIAARANGRTFSATSFAELSNGLQQLRCYE